MRASLLLLTILFMITACGYRTPLSLPKPGSKPPATTPVPAAAPVQSENK
jgi:predicted small lipoprotein YifL